MRTAITASACLLALAACGDDEETSTTPSADGKSWGGEVVDESDGVAKPSTPGTTPQVQKEGEPATGPTEDYRPVVPDAPAVATEGKEVVTDKGPSAWGATDAESGKALPKRSKPNAKATEEIRAGKKAAAKNDYAQARKHFEQALVADARAFEASHNLGVVADRTGQTNVALGHYAKALTIQPDYEDSAEGSAHIFVRQGQAAQAASFVQPLATQWERNLSLVALYASMLAEAGRLDESEQVARKALKRDERFVPAMTALAKASIKRGRLELADAILEQAIAVQPNNYEVHLLQARRHVEEGRTAQAVTSYKRAIELRNNNPEARSELGLLYLAAGNYTEAVLHLEQAVEMLSALPQPHLNLGDAYRASKRWQDAKKELDSALRMQPNLPEAHFNLGLMYYEPPEGFPGLSKLESLQRAQLELNTYRDQMGPRIAKDDPSVAYLTEIARQIEREQRRLEREANKKRTAAAAGESK
jgi:tetratricopeptide (TPR) repeat protein